MKRLLLFILPLLAVIISSCGRHEYPRALTDADSIADHDPQRARAILDSLRPTVYGSDEAVRNYYALLQIKIADKADRPLPKDSTVFRLVSYYEQSGESRLLPLAYYYAGRTLFTRNNAPEALDYYQKALESIGEDTSLLRLKACVYSQMGYVFFNQKIQHKSLEMAQKAYYCNLRLNNTKAIIYNLDHIAWTYSNLNSYNNAIVTYKKALNLAVRKQDKDDVVDICSELAYIYLDKKGKIDSAKKYLDMAVINNKGEKDRTLLAVSSKVYDKLGMYDSAYNENIKLLNFDNIYAKKMAVREIAKYKIRKGDNKSAAKYLEEYEYYLDSIQKITATEAVARMSAMYNYSSKEREAAELKVENEEFKKTLIFFVMVFIFVILLSIAAWIAIKLKKLEVKIKLQRGKQIEKELYESSGRYIKEKEKELSEVREEISKIEDKDPESANDLKEKLYSLNATVQTLKIKEAEHDRKQKELEGCDVSRRIKTRLQDSSIINKNLSETDWMEIEQTVSSYADNFKTRIEETCKISEQEYKVCLLLKLGLSPTEISKVMNKTKQAISMMRKRLYLRAFAISKGPEDWDRFIRSL